MFNRSTQHQSDTLDGRALGLGLLIGAAIGAGAALLLAPATGQQGRKVAVRMRARARDVAPW